MKREFRLRETGQLITIVMIKKGNYSYDFDKLVDNTGREWLPEQLERLTTISSDPYQPDEEIRLVYL